MTPNAQIYLVKLRCYGQIIRLSDNALVLHIDLSVLGTCSPVNNNVELVKALLISTDLGDGGMTLITWLPMNGAV